MRRDPPSARARRPSHQRVLERRLRRLSAGALLILCGCGTVGYQPSPLDPAEVLRTLRTADDLDPVGPASGEPSAAGLTIEQAAAFAVTRNPQLAAIRAEIGVAEARLVEAGLLPDPSIGWDAMDVLTNQWVNGDTEQENFVVGVGLSWRVPRPGEISAQEAIAAADLERSEWSVVRAEWALAQEVAEAWIEAVSVRDQLRATNELLELGRRTASVLERAREVRAASGIEANLAAIDVADIELERLRLEDEAIEAQQRLNLLLGLSPEADYPIASGEEFLTATPESPPDAAALVDAAVERRPDLMELVQNYEATEAELRLEIARQFPEVSIGTGIELTLPLLSRWNRPAIDRAYAQREAARRIVEAEIVRLRAEVHAAVAAYRKARRQSEYLSENVEPRLAESRRLAEASLAAREMSTLEVLLTQRQILDARLRTLSARYDAASAWVRLRAVTGQLFGTGVRRPPGAAAPKEEER